MLNTNLSFSARNAGPITVEAMRRIAPSIFAEAAHDSRSDRYTYIPTVDILAGLEKEGFRPFAVQQARARDEGRKEHTKHLIRLRHDSQAVAEVGDSVPEIVLVNSHDGTSSYKMIAGMFRLVCSNGLMIGSTIDEVRIPHKGDVGGRVIEGAYRVLSSIPEVQESVREMESLKLTEGQQLAFGRAAAALRWAPDEAGKMPVEPQQVIRSRRYGDSGDTLWQTFNRAQENLIRGGVRVRGADRSIRRSREVKGIDQSVGLNRALWTLAEEMRKLAS